MARRSVLILLGDLQGDSLIRVRLDALFLYKRHVYKFFSMFYIESKVATRIEIVCCSKEALSFFPNVRCYF